MPHRSSLSLLLVLVLALGRTKATVRPEFSSLSPECDGRQTLVHLFEWRWEDIANECETFLAPFGYCAVQISPPQEHRLMDGGPWHQRYQPVSYLLESRSGNRTEFVDMVERCNAVGVRIIVDAVINHMTEQHTEGYGSAGSHYVADNYDFPPYSGDSFFTDVYMCPNPNGFSNRVVTDYQNLNDIRDCRFLGFLDLYTSETPVQDAIAGYLNQMLDIGVAGFRIDSATYIWPEDLEFIYPKVNNLSVAAGFPEGTRPFIFHDVIAPGTAVKPSEYYHLGGVTETQYGKRAAVGVGNFSFLESMYDPALEMVPPETAVVFVDSHLTQRDSRIPPGDLLTYSEPLKYQMGNAFMLADSYGTARIMSSYEFSNENQGPPTAPDNSTLPVTIGADGLCEGGWICEHRWAPIANMVKFRNAVVGTNRTFELLTSGAILLQRGNLGFFAMHPLGSMDEDVSTGLPEGDYCDVVSDCGSVINVAADGTARVIITDPDVPFVAFCVGCGELAFSSAMTSNVMTTEGTTADMFTTGATTDAATTGMVLTTDAPTTAGATTGGMTTGGLTTMGPTTGAGTTDGLTTVRGTTNAGTTDSGTTDAGTTDSGTTDAGTTDSGTTDAGTTDSGTTEESTTASPYQRTVVFMKKQVFEDQYVFVRGGIEEENHPECGAPAETDPCALPMTLHSLGDTANYAKYNAWRVGDDFLDWFGAEAGQGSYTGIPASGSPMAWTTNQQGVDGYQELNIYGEDYWMMEFDMDCRLTPDGWFEIKGWLEFAAGFTGWELDINQDPCTGGVGGTAPYSSNNHKGRCGYINVFTWNEGNCIIDPFPSVSTPNPVSTVDPGSSIGPSVQRTVLFIEQHTVNGQDVFLLGGLQDPLSSTSTCSGGTAETDSCSLPIVSRSLGTTSHYSGYNDWRVGDDFLDWLGAEADQGLHNGVPPDGSPSAWTSNNPSSPGYQALNTFGDAYWMLDFDLDCSLTEGGWFTVKGWLAGDAGQFSGLEADVIQETCTGTAGGPPPYASKSHMAKCGHINVFHYDMGDCTINTF